MTAPRTDTHGPTSPLAQREWAEHLRRKQELIEQIMSGIQSNVAAVQAGGIRPDEQQPHQMPSIPWQLTALTPHPGPQAHEATAQAPLEIERSSARRNELLGQARFYGIAGAESMSPVVLEQQIERRRLGMPQDTTGGELGEAASGALGMAAAFTGTTAEIGRNLLGLMSKTDQLGLEQMGDTPFGKLALLRIKGYETARSWLGDLAKSTAEYSESVRAGLTPDDRKVYNVLTGGSKFSAYLAPYAAVERVLGAIGAAPSVVAYTSRLSPLARLAGRELAANSVLEVGSDDELREKAVTIGAGTALGVGLHSAMPYVRAAWAKVLGSFQTPGAALVSTQGISTGFREPVTGPISDADWGFVHELPGGGGPSPVRAMVTEGTPAFPALPAGSPTQEPTAAAENVRQMMNWAAGNERRAGQEAAVLAARRRGRYADTRQLPGEPSLSWEEAAADPAISNDLRAYAARRIGEMGFPLRTPPREFPQYGPGLPGLSGDPIEEIASINRQLMDPAVPVATKVDLTMRRDVLRTALEPQPAQPGQFKLPSGETKKIPLLPSGARDPYIEAHDEALQFRREQVDNALRSASQVRERIRLSSPDYENLPGLERDVQYFEEVAQFHQKALYEESQALGRAMRPTRVKPKVALMPSMLQGTKVVAPNGLPVRVYRGTSRVYDVEDPATFDPDALFGPGIYGTEDYVERTGLAAITGGDPLSGRPGYAGSVADQDYTHIQQLQDEIAQFEHELANDPLVQTNEPFRQGTISGIARRKAELAEALQEVPRPNVRPTYMRIENPFDIDAVPDIEGTWWSDPMHPLGKILRAGQELYPDADWNGIIEPIMRQVRDSNTSTNETVYRVLEEMGIAREGPSQLIGGWMDVNPGNTLGKPGVNQILQAAGYDGITHMGGARSNNAPHKVWIAFHPHQVHSAFDVEALARTEAEAQASVISKQAALAEAPDMAPELIRAAEITDHHVVKAVAQTNPGGVSVVRGVTDPSAAILGGQAAGVPVRLVEYRPTSQRPLPIALDQQFDEEPLINEVLQDEHFQSLVAFQNAQPVVEAPPRIDALVGDITDAQLAQYSEHGLFVGQEVTTASGVEAIVHKVPTTPRGKVVVKRAGGGPPLTLKYENVLPGSKSTGTTTHDADALWESFKLDTMMEIGDDATREGLPAPTSIFDPQVMEMIGDHVEEFLDARGVTAAGERQILMAEFNSRWVRDLKTLAPEEAEIFDGAMAQLDDAVNRGVDRSIELPLEEKAESKGFMWLSAPENGGILQDMSNPLGSHEFAMETDEAAEEFLRTVNREIPDLMGDGQIPPEILGGIEGSGASSQFEPALGAEDLAASLDDQAGAWEETVAEAEAAAAAGVPGAEPGTGWQFGEGSRRVNWEWGTEEGMYRNDPAYREMLDAMMADERTGMGQGPPQIPPGGRRPGSVEGPIPPEPEAEVKETLREQFRKKTMADPEGLGATLERLNGLRSRFLEWTRYRMLHVEEVLNKSGITLGRAWEHYDALSNGITRMHEEMRPWLKEASVILRQMDSRALREGAVTRIHEIQDHGARMNAWVSYAKKRGWGQRRMVRNIAADEQLKAFNAKFFQYLVKDPAYALTAEREIMQYMSHVRARQARGMGTEAYKDNGFLSPRTEFFAEFARDGNLQFRVMDARTLTHHMLRAAMWKKNVGPAWEQLSKAWSFQVPDHWPNANLIRQTQASVLDFARVAKQGHDAEHDFAVKAVRGLFRNVLKTPVTTREAVQLLNMPTRLMYPAYLGLRTAVLFRDSIQPLLAGAKVGTRTIAAVYRDVLGSPTVAREMYQRGIMGGWIERGQQQFESAGFMETPLNMEFDPANVTAGSNWRRELVSRAGDLAREASPQILRGADPLNLPLKPYQRLGEFNRMISGEAGYRRATQAIADFRSNVLRTAMDTPEEVGARQAAHWNGLMEESTAGTFEPPIQRKFQELLHAGQDDEAAKLIAREVANWSQFRYGIRELPPAARGTFGRVGLMFGNFSGQMIHALSSMSRNGSVKARVGGWLTVGAVTATLAALKAKTGWGFDKWIWNPVFTGGPAVEPAMEMMQTVAGVTSDIRGYGMSPTQEAASVSTLGMDPAATAFRNFNPYYGAFEGATQLEAAARGINPGEQALRYMLTGDRGSRIDLTNILEERARGPSPTSTGPSRAFPVGGGLAP